MPPRPGLTRERLVDFASALVDREGPDGLTLAKVAQHFGVRTPSLYNHVRGVDALRRELRLRGLRGIAGVLGAAAVGRSGGDALHAVAHAYRGYAREHPGLYALAQRGATDGDAEVAAAAASVLEIVLATLRGYGLTGDDALHATRFLRSALHGFVALESEGGFALALDRDESFERAVRSIDRALRAFAAPEAGDPPAGGARDPRPSP